MGTLLLVTLLVIEMVMLVATLRGWIDRQRVVPYVRIGVILVFVLLIVTGVVEWSPRYYAIAIWMVVFAAWGLTRRNRPAKTPGTGRVVAVGLGVAVVTFLAVAPALIFPEYTPLTPTGAHEVRTATYTVTDTSRIDPYSKHGHHRLLTYGVWHPDTAEGRFPLVVFSHGGMGIRNSNQSMFEDLASHGYVVASIDHTWHALFSTDVTGHQIWIDGGYLGELRNEDATTDPEGSLSLYRKWMGIRIADIDFVLTHILTNTDAVHRLVDPDRIGLAGHSLGGAAVLGAGRVRDDVDAVIALEAPFMADIEAVVDGRFVWNPDPYPVPVLNVYSDSAWDHLDEWPQYRRNREMLDDPTAHNIHLEDVGHLHLTDLSMTSPFLTRFLNGHPSAGDAREALERLNRHALRFFDSYLKDLGTFSP